VDARESALGGWMDRLVAGLGGFANWSPLPDGRGASDEAEISDCHPIE